MNKHHGLKEQIAHAETEQQVINLFKNGQSLQDASPRTKLSWKNTAQRRLRQLIQQQSTNNEPANTNDLKNPIVKKGKKTGIKR